MYDGRLVFSDDKYKTPYFKGVLYWLSQSTGLLDSRSKESKIWTKKPTSNLKLQTQYVINLLL